MNVPCKPPSDAMCINIVMHGKWVWQMVSLLGWTSLTIVAGDNK